MPVVHVLKRRCLPRDPRTRAELARMYAVPLKLKLAARATKHADWRATTVWEYFLAIARMGG